MSKPRKLNIFQRGALQLAALMIVSMVLGSALTFLFDWLEKKRFINVVVQVQDKGIINREAAQHLQYIINTLDVAQFPVIVVFFAIGILIIWWLMCLAAGLNWSKRVTLPKAVEFSSAMRKIGEFDFEDQKACVQKHHLRVYIATEPFRGEERENVQAKLYPSSYNRTLFLESVLTTNIGKRLLCLDADDYDRVRREYSPPAKETGLAIVGELEQENQNLKGALSIKEAENTELKRENAQLQEENAEYREQEKMEFVREGKTEKERQRRAPFWQMALPLIVRLMAVPEIKYSRPQIQTEFEKELKNHPELKPAIKSLLHTPKKEKEKTPFDLEGWGMERIREVLGHRAQTDGGRPPEKG